MYNLLNLLSSKKLNNKTLAMKLNKDVKLLLLLKLLLLETNYMK